MTMGAVLAGTGRQPEGGEVWKAALTSIRPELGAALGPGLQAWLEREQQGKAEAPLLRRWLLPAGRDPPGGCCLPWGQEPAPQHGQCADGGTSPGAHPPSSGGPACLPNRQGSC